jgi:hypothetical protein
VRIGVNAQNPPGEKSCQGPGRLAQAHAAFLATDAKYHHSESSENASRQNGDNDKNRDDGAHQNRAISMPSMTAAGNDNPGGVVCMTGIMRQGART